MIKNLIIISILASILFSCKKDCYFSGHIPMPDKEKLYSNKIDINKLDTSIYYKIGLLNEKDK